LDTRAVPRSGNIDRVEGRWLERHRPPL